LFKGYLLFPVVQPKHPNVRRGSPAARQCSALHKLMKKSLKLVGIGLGLGMAMACESREESVQPGSRFHGSIMTHAIIEAPAA